MCANLNSSMNVYTFIISSGGTLNMLLCCVFPCGSFSAGPLGLRDSADKMHLFVLQCLHHVASTDLGEEGEGVVGKAGGEGKKDRLQSIEYICLYISCSCFRLP